MQEDERRQTRLKRLSGGKAVGRSDGKFRWVRVEVPEDVSGDECSSGCVLREGRAMERTTHRSTSSNLENGMLSGTTANATESESVHVRARADERRDVEK